ncbi:glycine-rich domain-containing protein [Yersinia enterocolitica]
MVDANGFGGRLTGKPQIITSTGTYTPTPGCKFAIVELVGGGGGGGGCWLADASGASAGGGGGSGGYSLFFFKNPVATAVTIGLGGAQGPVSLNSSPDDGTPGGDTLFGSLAIAKGGYGGLSTAWAVATGTSDTACTDGGGGAPAGTGDIALPGNAGQRGQQLSRNGSAGNGAPSKLGSGAFRARGNAGVLYQPTFGGGGLGNYRVSNATTPGTNGADGLCKVWEFF